MAFDYDDVHTKNNDDLTGHWAPYADLFIMMSVVFLMCYAVAKLYGSSSAIQQQAEYQKIQDENNDLKEQLKVYSTLRDDYLKNGASESDQKMYRDLTNKLSLLQDQARVEKEELREHAKENERKEQALNRYQQMVRNIINANLVASARIKTRDQMLDKRDQTIAKEHSKVRDLKTEVSQMQSEIEERQQQIEEANQRLNTRRQQLQQSLKSHQISKAKFSQALKKMEKQTQDQIENLKSQNAKVREELAQTQAAVDSLDKKRQSLEQKTAALSAEKNSLVSETNSLKGQASNLRSQRDSLQSDYNKMRQLANARRDLAGRIMNNFNKAGIKAEVDKQTGDVTISFGNEYFDSDRANLKPRMTSLLKETIPVYSRSLFEDPKIAKKIKAIEIVGFASPTYKGKFVDPTSMSSEDRGAINYNMDLSYRRARAIFDYVFDPAKMSYENQERLLPLVKVTGRSYLAERQSRDVANVGDSIAEYCAKYDCKQAQKVIIKFNLDE